MNICRKMGRENSSLTCCAFCLCRVEVTPDKKQGGGRKLILEKFYTEFINNPTFSQLKLKRNVEKEEDKPADNWTICGECSPHINKALGSKAKVDKVETEVRRLQRRVVEEMRGLLEEMDGMCGDMVMIEGILSNRNEYSDAASGRGMRGKCREFKDRIIDNLRNFQRGIGDKMVSSDIPRGAVQKALKVTTLKASKSKKRKPPIIRSQPPKDKHVPVIVTPTTTVPKLDEKELKIEVMEEPACLEEDNDRDSWHWSGNDNDDNNDGPQSPEQPQQNLPFSGLPKSIMVMLTAKSKKKRKRTSHLHYAKKGKTTVTMTSKPKTVKTANKKPTAFQADDHDIWHGNDDDAHQLPEEPVPVPNSPFSAVPVPDAKDLEKATRTADSSDEDDGKDEISSESDTSDEDFDPQNKALIDFKDIKSNRKMTKFCKNFIVRINQHSTIATSSSMPPDPTDDPRRPHKFFYNSTKNKFYVDDTEVHWLDNLEDNPNGDKFGLRCSLCEYTVNQSGKRRPRDYIEDDIFDHMLGKHFKVYHCTKCEDKSFETFTGLKIHQRSHEMEFICDICERPLGGPDNLRLHRWTHLSQEEKEDPSNERYKPDYVKKSVTGKNFICEVCGKGFRVKRALNEHEETHKKEEEREKVICETCGKSVLAKAYKMHKRKWCKPPRDLRCHVCGGGVKNVRELYKHLIKMHPEVRSYECDVCGSKFKTKPQMRNHREIHKEERDYLCKYCGRGFKQKKNCNRHEKSCGGGGGDEGKEMKQEMELQEQEQPSTSYGQSSWTPL